MRISTKSINQKIKSDVTDFIEKSDRSFHKQVKETVNTIANDSENSPIILLSGPSGSGKTTTALTIESILDRMGYETHTISMDNYFVPLSDEERVKLANGELDLESPTRVDTDLLNSQLQDMLDNKKVELPKFNFKNNTREKSGIFLERKKNELILLEGIHALNPDVVQIDDDATFTVYVSVRTRVKSDDCLLHPSLIRLLRRMLRDKNFRSREIKGTLEMFNSVQLGEQRYIAPYKYRADFDIDTFFAYEMSVYKKFLYDDLQKLSGDKRIDDILSVMNEIEIINKEKIDKNALIREFIGDSAFKY